MKVGTLVRPHPDFPVPSWFVDGEKRNEATHGVVIGGLRNGTLWVQWFPASFRTYEMQEHVEIIL